MRRELSGLVERRGVRLPIPGPESGGDFVTGEQLEVVRNGAVHQANSRGKADRFVFYSATKLPPDSWPNRY